MPKIGTLNMWKKLKSFVRAAAISGLLIGLKLVEPIYYVEAAVRLNNQLSKIMGCGVCRGKESSEKI
jgi:hypothetical protein